MNKDKERASNISKGSSHENAIYNGVLDNVPEFKKTDITLNYS